MTAVGRLIVRVEPRLGPTLTVPCPADLRFSAVIPGGYDQLTGTIPWPRGTQPPGQLTGMAVVQAVDVLTGQVVWHGRIDDPGRQVRPVRDGYQVSASGERVAVDRVQLAYALVDRDPASWVHAGDLPSGQATKGTDSGGLAASSLDWADDAPTSYLETSVAKDTAWTAGMTSTWQYLPAVHSEGPGVVQVTGSTKVADASLGGSWVTRVLVGPTVDGAVQVHQHTCSTTQVDWAAVEGGAGWASTLDARAVLVRSVYTGAGATPTVDMWHRTANVAVHGVRYDRWGATVDPDPGDPAVFELTAADIHHDLIGRALMDVVEVAAILEEPPARVEQAAWWRGVSAAEVLSFIATFAPHTWWAVWEPGESGRPRYEFSSWLTPVRWVIPPGFGAVDLAGGADDLADEALVTYLAAQDVPATVRVAVPVALLDAESVTRTVRVDLTDRGPITRDRAVELGENALAARAVRKPGGKVRISEPILDQATGRVVDPWEVRPGGLVHVMDAADRVSPDRPDVPDGVSVYRVTATSFDAGSGSVELSLDGGSRTLVTRVAAEVTRMLEAS